MIIHMKPSNKFTPSSTSNYKFTYNTKNGQSSGCCFRRILRRIFCISSLSSCPSHHIKEEEKDPLLPDASAAPGIVARLMGLESLPDIETNSIRKSRSKVVRRRKNIPTYTEVQDDKFFILSFDQGGDPSMEDSMKKNSNSAEKKLVMRAKRKKKRIQDWNKENVGVNEVSEEDLDKITDFHVRNLSNVQNLCQKSHLDVKKMGKQERLAVVKLGIGDDSENSSPNSVLDYVESPPDSETACSGDTILRLAKSSKLRKTLSEELENYRKSEKRRLIKNGCDEEEENRSRLRNRNRNSAKKLDKIGMLAARETVKSNWLEHKILKTHHHFKDITRDLASEILDQLLSELLINFL